MRRRMAAVVLAAAMVAVTLTGCSWSQAPVAARVGGTTITLAQAQQVADALVADTAKNPQPLAAGDAPRVAVQGLVLNALLNSAPDKGESIVPQASVAQAIDPTVFASLLTTPGGAEWARGEIAVSQARATQSIATSLIDLGRSTSVEINPRFGTWNTATGWFGPTDGSLSVEAADAPSLLLP